MGFLPQHERINFAKDPTIFILWWIKHFIFCKSTFVIAGNKELFIKWTYPEYFSLLRNGAWGCFEKQKKVPWSFIKILIFWLAPATLDIFLKGLPCNPFSTFNFLFEIVSKSEFFNLFLRFYVDKQLCPDNVVKPFTMWSMLELSSNNIA